LQNVQLKKKKEGELFFPNLFLTITLSTASVLKLVWDFQTSTSELCFHPNHTDDQASLRVYICIYTHAYTCTHYVYMCVYVHISIHTWHIYICMYTRMCIHTQTKCV